MAANADRGELDVHLGEQTRTLRFRAQESMVLEDRLGSDPLAYLARGGGQTKFLIDAVLSGLSYDRGLKLTPGKVAQWLDDAEHLDREQFQKDVLYAVARGKSKAEADKMVRALDEAFGTSSEAASEGKAR
jgi:hypothetical protein